MKKLALIMALALALSLGMLAGCSNGDGAAAGGDAQQAQASTTIPDEVFADGCDAAGLADGVYAMDIEFAGGTGKASIDSPTTVAVKGGKVAAEVVWSSPNYDYMLINGKRYDQINTDGGNSVFQIPVTVLDGPMEVVGDTTAMSTPHEIDYTVTFISSSAKAK